MIEATGFLDMMFMFDDAATYQVNYTVGSETQPFEIWKHLKSGLFKGWISNGRASVMAIAIVPTI